MCLAVRSVVGGRFSFLSSGFFRVLVFSAGDLRRVRQSRSVCVMEFGSRFCRILWFQVSFIWWGGDFGCQVGDSVTGVVIIVSYSWFYLGVFSFYFCGLVEEQLEIFQFLNVRKQVDFLLRVRLVFLSILGEGLGKSLYQLFVSSVQRLFIFFFSSVGVDSFVCYTFLFIDMGRAGLWLFYFLVVGLVWDLRLVNFGVLFFCLELWRLLEFFYKIQFVGFGRERGFFLV